MDNFRIPVETHIRNVHLQVTDMRLTQKFYSGLLGFQILDEADGTTFLSASRIKPPILLLTENLNSVPKPPRTTGLYHMAIRVPNRLELARVFRQLLESDWPLYGISDHLVSEAIYLADPEGNGIEIYYDRPKNEWSVENGQVAMSTESVAPEDLLSELKSDGRPWHGIDSDTDMGHVHLQVSDLARSEHFYHDMLGFDVTQRDYPGALFFSAGGYHHHIGVNTWSSRGSQPPPPDAIGLISFTIVVPDEASWLIINDRLVEAGLSIQDWSTENRHSLLVRDPNSIGVEIATS